MDTGHVVSGKMTIRSLKDNLMFCLSRILSRQHVCHEFAAERQHFLSITEIASASVRKGSCPSKNTFDWTT